MKLFEDVTKHVTGFDAGALGRGMDIEYLMGMPTDGAAMVTLGKLWAEKKSWLFLRNKKDG